MKAFGEAGFNANRTTSPLVSGRTSRPMIDQNVKPAVHVARPQEMAFGKEPTLAPADDPRGPLLQHPMRHLYSRAAERHAAMDAYTFRLKRREVVNGVGIHFQEAGGQSVNWRVVVYYSTREFTWLISCGYFAESSPK